MNLRLEKSIPRPVLHLFLWCLLTLFYYVVYSRVGGDYVWVFVVKELFVQATLFYFVSWLVVRPLFRKYVYLIIGVLALGYLWWGGWLYLVCWLVQRYADTSDGYFDVYLNLVLDKGILGIFAYDKFPVLVLDYIFMVSLPLLPKIVKTLMEQVNENTKLERDRLMMEVNFLKSQVTPHFLFNTLNSIYRMAELQDPRVGETILKLSEMMRYMLYDVEDKPVSLQREIGFIVNYLSLAKMRFGTGVKVEIDIEDINEPYLVMPLLLIPFVENAVKHGPERSRKGAWLEVKVRIENGYLNFGVSNGVNPQAKPAEVGGVGIINVYKRLDMFYKERYDLKIKALETEYHILLHLKL